jgi:hypothetical protein
MPRQVIRQFDATLDQLFASRTHWLKSLIRKKSPGAAPKINRKKIQKAIRKLQGSAVEALLTSRLLRPLGDFFDQKKQWHPKKGKGFGVEAKAKAFRAWYDEHIHYSNCVYAFWNGNSCLYIGRTLNGKGRPSSHFNKHWFSKATRIDIYCSSAKKRVPAFECRLTHVHEPSYSRLRPARSKYFWRCEICEVEGEIRNEMKSIFALR